MNVTRRENRTYPLLMFHHNTNVIHVPLATHYRVAKGCQEEKENLLPFCHLKEKKKNNINICFIFFYFYFIQLVHIYHRRETKKRTKRWTFEIQKKRRKKRLFVMLNIKLYRSL